jgi:hypothetical protein
MGFQAVKSIVDKLEAYPTIANEIVADLVIPSAGAMRHGMGGTRH